MTFKLYVNNRTIYIELKILNNFFFCRSVSKYRTIREQSTRGNEIKITDKTDCKGLPVGKYDDTILIIVLVMLAGHTTPLPLECLLVALPRIDDSSDIKRFLW